MLIHRKTTPLVISLFLILAPECLFAQKFKHPGIDQSAEDLAYVKKQVLASNQPWKDALEQLKERTDLSASITPFAHVQRGPYGKPNVGGGELSKDAGLAYDCALLWYITGDETYAHKAIAILNAWSPVLRHFDYNDAKLLAGWTGHVLCNAAEILRYNQSGWQQRDIDEFTRMLMTVYYPVLRFYFPEANGNWDGAIIHSLLAIAIFTDNTEMFDNAVNHFLRGPVNGGLFKYIYPSGQCQESIRDQSHVQLGLGEFAGAARVAYTQGVDLFSAGNNRLALGYEYTAGFLLGEKPQSYGIISERSKEIRDDYEFVYRHYKSRGLDLPFTKSAADAVRSRSTRNTLTASRAPSSRPTGNQSTPKASNTGYPAGALDIASPPAPEGSVTVFAGQSIQDALDSASGKGQWVIAKRGIHTLPGTLMVPSGVTLAGEGIGTILFLNPASGVRDAIANAASDLHDVTIRDLVIEGGTKTDPGSDPNSTRSFRNPANRGGIMFIANRQGDIKNINLINLTVRNCTYNGVFLNGVNALNIICCDFSENGSSVVPGPKLQHNLLITRSSGIVVKDSRLDTSPHGSGAALIDCMGAKLTNCEIARNAYYGVLISESGNITISGNLIEANDRSGVMAEFLYKGSENISVTGNQIQYNGRFGIESYATRKMIQTANKFEGNGTSEAQYKITKAKAIIMQ
jgi:parallel beta-helix repeat protein